jgi:mRNA interferase RelE/StbE
MAYTVIVAPAAKRDLKRLPAEALRRVAEAIDHLADEPRPHGSVKLQGATDLYRIRIGDYRVVYQIHDRQLRVLIVRVGHRRDIYDLDR